MKVNVYASYGVLAHEKQPVYTVGNPESDINEKITVDIPEKFSPCENEIGDILVTIDGGIYTLHEVLTNKGDKPALRWYDGHFTRLQILEVIK